MKPGGAMLPSTVYTMLLEAEKIGKI